MPQVDFLRIDGLFDERALRPVQKKAGRVAAARMDERKSTRKSSRVMKREVERIVRNRALAFDANIGGQRLRHAEKHKRVVDQMRRKIKKDAAAWAGSLAPSSRIQLRTKAVVIRFKANDASQRAVGNNLQQRLKIAVVPPILINGNDASLLLRKSHERDRFFQRGRERFVHQHIASAAKHRCARE